MIQWTAQSIFCDCSEEFIYFYFRLKKKQFHSTSLYVNMCTQLSRKFIFVKKIFWFKVFTTLNQIKFFSFIFLINRTRFYLGVYVNNIIIEKQNVEYGDNHKRDTSVRGTAINPHLNKFLWHG